MKKKLIIIYAVFLLALLILSIIITSCSPTKTHVSGSYVEINGERIFVEVPRTNEEMMKGLMFREDLCDDCGMLFVFGHEDYHAFWMKNTFIHLDMVFINTNLEVVDVLHATPCVEEPCKSYTPKEKALYVLETNLNKFDESIIGEKASIVVS